MNLQTCIDRIEPSSAEWRAKARARLEQLTMPHWALGMLMDLAENLAGMTQSMKPPVQRKAIVVMAGDHGVAAEGVSAYPPEVTPQMVHNFVNGGAGINALAANVGARVLIADLGVASDLSALGDKILHRKVAAGTGNIAVGPAMTREQAVAALEAGIGIAHDLAGEIDVFGTGDMGIANTTPSAAIVAALTHMDAELVTGRGTGVDDARWKTKVAVVRKALEVNRPDPFDGLDVLAKVGGFEIAGLAGLILGAASLHKPVVVDGFISTAGALIAHTLCPAAADYMVMAHNSAEIGHRAMLARLQKTALLDLGFRLGEGTGAAVAMHLVDGAVRILTDVATFEEAAVSGKS